MSIFRRVIDYVTGADIVDIVAKAATRNKEYADSLSAASREYYYSLDGKSLYKECVALEARLRQLELVR